MFTINSSEFRHLIKIYRATTTKDEDNIPTKELKLLFSTRAKVLNLRGDELQKGKGIAYKQEKRLYFRTVRNTPIHQADVVEYNGANYNITFVNDVEELGRYTEIKMELVE